MKQNGKIWKELYQELCQEQYHNLYRLERIAVREGIRGESADELKNDNYSYFNTFNDGFCLVSLRLLGQNMAIAISNSF